MARPDSTAHAVPNARKTSDQGTATRLPDTSTFAAANEASTIQTDCSSPSTHQTGKRASPRQMSVSGAVATKGTRKRTLSTHATPVGSPAKVRPRATEEDKEGLTPPTTVLEPARRCL